MNIYNNDDKARCMFNNKHINNIKYKLTDNNGVPYISTYYYNPKPFNDEELVIPFYITDYYQKEYLSDDTSQNFIVEYEVDGVKKSVNMKAGDRELNLGTLSSGEHWFSLQVINNGVKSHKLYNEFLVIDRNSYDMTPSQTYTVTQNDLDKYGIKTNNSTVEIDMTNTREGLTLLFNEIRTNGYKKCVLLNGIYRINWDRDQDDGFGSYYKPLSIPSKFTVDLNGATIKLDGNTGNGGIMVLMQDCFDSHLINGTLDGNYDVFNITGEKGEHLYATVFEGCKYSSFEDLTIKNITGYACLTKSTSVPRVIIPSETWIKNIYMSDGNEISMENKYTCDFVDISTMLNDKYISVNRFLGYQGFEGSSMYVDIHFYDENKQFLQTIKAIQYRKIRILDNAKYIRVTLDKSESTNSIDLQATNFYTTTNCAFKNIKYINTRACALAPTAFNNLLIENCTFDNCGQNLTPLAIDFEDGWEMGQDCYFRNNTILTPSGTGDFVTCRGMNYVIENCDNFRVDFRGGTIAPVYRNNLNSSSVVYYSSPFRVRSCYCRIYNNVFNKGGCQLSTDYDYSGDLQAMPSAIKDCIFIGSCPSTNNTTSKCINCNIDLESVPDYDYSTYISEALRMYGGTLRNLKAVNTIIGDVKLNNVEVNNIQNVFFGIRSIDINNSTLEDVSIKLHNFDSNTHIENSNLTNFYLNTQSWCNSASNIELKGCQVNNVNKIFELENLNNGILKITDSDIVVSNDVGIKLYGNASSVYSVVVANNNISCKNYLISKNINNVSLENINNTFNSCVFN